MAANDQPVRPQTQWPPQTQTQPQPQQQPQLHATFPLGSKQSEARKFTAKDWEELRSEITRLYENNALNKVIELMAEQHGLSAT
jgi:ribulose bisphosphate carboxylase small subunit